jgi:hypothetical protein
MKTVRDSVSKILTTGFSFHFFNQQAVDYIYLCIQNFRSICFSVIIGEPFDDQSLQTVGQYH